MTRDEVQKWQIQKDHAEAGTSDADGNLGPLQAAKIFTKSYVVKDHD
jgi:hypothetical protein